LSVSGERLGSPGARGFGRGYSRARNILIRVIAFISALIVIIVVIIIIVIIIIIVVVDIFYRFGLDRDR